jgi:hypothetical protein
MADITPNKFDDDLLQQNHEGDFLDENNHHSAEIEREFQNGTEPNYDELDHMIDQNADYDQETDE